MTFDQLVDEATRSIHSSLLEGGSEAMKTRIFVWMQTAIAWEKEQQKKIK